MSEAELLRHNLRVQMRKARGSLEAEQLATAADAFYKHLGELPEYTTAQHISAYIAVRGEMDPSVLISRAVTDKKQIYLPVLDGKQLLFAPWAPGEALAQRRFGLLEPDVPRAQMLAPRELDLVLVPLLAFDTEGNRLGMGGGFYDRSFAFLHQQPGKPVFCGIAHDFQRTPQLPAEPWDVPLNLIITDSRVYRPRASTLATE
jgi:5-formyltetrahydrofolate cyclo-ligase